MKWTPWFLGSLTAIALGACGGGQRDAGTSGSGTETGTMQGGTAGDTASARTGMMGTQADTMHGAGMHSDTAMTGGTDTSRSGRDTSRTSR